MGVDIVFLFVLLSSVGHVLTEDISHHSRAEPDVKNPVDYKGIVLVAVISALVIILLIVPIVILFICYCKRCRKRAREEQENNGGNGTATPLMTIMVKDVDTGFSSTEAIAL